jgi:YebC/PmpR family DNA-binding regulatory protein
MSGHSKWSQIKHKKGVTDQKRGQAFSKLLKAVSVASREEPNPQMNPRLRSLIEKAKEANVPNENIERALKRSSEAKELEEVVIEAYGPEKTALIIECITDNKNRTVAELRHLLTEQGAKFAESGSVRWNFEAPGARGSWKAKAPHAISNEGHAKLTALIEALEIHDDVQKIVTDSEERPAENL